MSDTYHSCLLQLEEAQNEHYILHIRSDDDSVAFHLAIGVRQPVFMDVKNRQVRIQWLTGFGQKVTVVPFVNLLGMGASMESLKNGTLSIAVPIPEGTTDVCAAVNAFLSQVEEPSQTPDEE